VSGCTNVPFIATVPCKGTTIWVITVRKGAVSKDTGSCTLASTRLRDGTYTFVALYNESKSSK
jgi:hypothetical protein